ncbi:MAG: type II toxin-antitoxin system HipA family toxin [Pseudolysinimonas sp.]
MAFIPTEVIEVRAWGRSVGAVAPSDARGAFAFQYFPEWIDAGFSISPLHLPLERRPLTFPGQPLATWYGLPPAIADSLPDRFGNDIVTAELTRRGASAGQITALDRLAYTGHRAMGALEFVEDIGPGASASTLLNIGELVVVARDVIAGRIGDDAESRAALQQILTIGTSAGGARAKAVVNLNPVTGDLRPGQLPTPGYEAWLLKFDGIGDDLELGASLPYGRIEYAYSHMARSAGIELSPTRLLEENGRAHFMTRRFDRGDGGERIHMQSLCAMAMLDFNAIGVHDYAQLHDTIRSLELGDAAASEAYRRMVFNVAAANCDDHTKNHGFLMDATGSWSLSPAFDVTHAHNPESRWTAQHLMSVNGKFTGIERADLLEFAERQDIRGARAIIEQVADAVAQWPEFAAEAGVPDEAVERVAADLVRM